MPDLPLKLKLPSIQKVSLRRFSLFDANPDAEFSCGPGVLCLVGANGIGKSTLLAAINFCLTGTVPEPNRSFQSIDEYYRYTRAYSGGYFRGRIAGSDEDGAEITLSFKIGSFEYEVSRGFFEADELRGLTIREYEGREPVVSTDGMARRERHQVYSERLVQDSGLASFEEFVFLQHFVFTFDEQRKILFWSPRILERVLYRAFGFDPEMAKKADGLQREIEHEDSRVRNSQWDATKLRKRINEIRSRMQAASGAQQSYDTLVADHETLSRQFDDESKRLRNLENAIRDASLKLADQSVRETALRDEYTRVFERRMEARPPLAQHPLISASLADGRCGLCGSSASDVQSTIEVRVNSATCPLCGSGLRQESQPSEASARLQEIDRELAQLRRSIKDAHKSMEGLRKAEAAARGDWEKTKEHLDEFDRKNSTTLDALRRMLDQSGGDRSLGDYKNQLAQFEKEKKTAYERREDLKRQLLKLQRDLEQHYRGVEESFVPAFADLAQGFLGMSLAVQMEASTIGEVKLIVSVRGTTRRLQEQLSESQRFFLDIAFRMALTNHMSDPGSKGALIIDTPEGSLDIAYEKRAGDMLAKFASSGHQVVMTANLNTSQLLLALARDCGRAKMQLCRMTDWAELSEVQKEEEALFEQAYGTIEEAMGGAQS